MRGSLDALAERGFGEALIVVVRDGREVVWQPEGGVWPALLEQGEHRLLEFGTEDCDEPLAEGDTRELVVGIG